ncbi:MAG: branched-chain amino acid ABC transporter permease [Oscillospiraceae bacterium]|nr:branched-chain amino acid ABC transporter permease [Oscillospiraceae bacterium]
MAFIKRVLPGTARGRLHLGALICVAAFLAVFPGVSRPYTTIFTASILMYIILSLSWTFFSGKTGYISLATAAFYGIGMYIEAILGRYIPLPAAMLVAAAAGFLIAAGIGAITLRLRGVYFTIFTFGLVLLLQNLVLWIEIRFFHTKGRIVTSGDFTFVYYCILAVFVILLIAAVIMRRSRFGLALECIGQNEDSAAHIGVDTTRTKILAFAVSAAPVSAVGAAMATRVGYIDPNIAFNLLMSFMPVLMAIFGGTHSLYGPVFGALVLTLLEEKLIRGYQEYYMIIFGAVMIIAVSFMPKGAAGIAESVFLKLRRRLRPRSHPRNDGGARDE